MVIDVCSEECTMTDAEDSEGNDVEDEKMAACKVSGRAEVVRRPLHE